MAQIKTQVEITKIQKACKITDQIFKKVISNFYFKTEIELRDFILSEIKKRGLKPSFPPIVSSGQRAGNEIHPSSTAHTLKGFVIIDFGVIYEKYMSDMTRTIFVGKPTDNDRMVYNLVLKSQLTGVNLVKPGTKCGAVDQKVRDILGRYKKYFIHTLGHGVGRRIHESPKLFFKYTRPSFKTGMVVTIEPGIYVPKKFGIRIEDTGVVTRKSFKVFTKSPKALLVF